MGRIEVKNMQDVAVLADKARIALGPDAGPIASNAIKVIGAIALAEPRSEGNLEEIKLELAEHILMLRNSMKELSRAHPELELIEIDAL
ncbi:hypothetical protein C4544_02745 [candidate division WS5 bacterium]|uniref:Uncharacterized protein n=1 Tax=candidate division WS5 bacterium TaxID=2093353 RepID=A0A419DE44_9BACT|nr:MAG: hypothetical protein C4544_02745 [candidate division WS5 bacterium]